MKKLALTMVVVLGLALAACAPPTPKVVPVTVEVTKEVVITPTPPKVGAVSVLGVWGGFEFEAFSKAVAPLTKETGIGMAFEATRDLPAVLTTRVEAGNPPDIAILPNPGQMRGLAKEGVLVDLSTFLDMERFKKDYAQSWIDLGSYKGTLYGILIAASNKSLVWYNPKAFEAAGYEVPTTWEELIALSDQMVADGNTPWCIGLESGAASGWPGTDWIEDIMLRTAGPEVYDKWVAHEIPWTDPAVKKAWELFGKIATTEDYVYGGTTGVLATNFGDSPVPMFDSPPGCFLHRQASFITTFILDARPELKPVEDFTFFPLPPIKPEFGTPVLGGANVVVAFNDTPIVRKFMQYLASPKPHEILAKELGWLSPNKRTSLDAYPDPLTRKAAEVLVGAEVFRFDASDLMPAAVGSGSFWSGVMDYVGGKDLDSVLEAIEASAVEVYGE